MPRQFIDGALIPDRPSVQNADGFENKDVGFKLATEV